MDWLSLVTSAILAMAGVLGATTHEEVGGLDILMNYMTIVRVLQRLSSLTHDALNGGQRQRTFSRVLVPPVSKGAFVP